MSAAEKVLAGELLEALRHQANTQTEFMERLAGQAINNVLEVWSGVIPAEGYIQKQWHVAAGCIEVNNLGVAANLMTVSTASPGAGGNIAPSGTGTYVIAGQTRRTVALASRTVTIYGTPGDRVAIQVFTAALRPGTA